MSEARHPGIGIVLLRVLNLLPYPSVASSPCDAGQVRTCLSALALKAVATNATLVLKKCGSVGRTLCKEKNDNTDYGYTAQETPFHVFVHTVNFPARKKVVCPSSMRIISHPIITSTDELAKRNSSI